MIGITIGLAMLIGIFSGLNLESKFKSHELSATDIVPGYKPKKAAEPEKESTSTGVSWWQKTKDAVGMGETKPDSKFVDLPNGAVQKITPPPEKKSAAVKSNPAQAPMVQAKNNYAPVAQAQHQKASVTPGQNQVEGEDESTPTLDALNSQLDAGAAAQRRP